MVRKRAMVCVCTTGDRQGTHHSTLLCECNWAKHSTLYYFPHMPPQCLLCPGRTPRQYGMSEKEYMDSLEGGSRLLLGQHHPSPVATRPVCLWATEDSAQYPSIWGDLVMGKRQLPTVFKMAYPKAGTASNIKEGFQRTGLFPLDRLAVDSSQVQNNKDPN